MTAYDTTTLALAILGDEAVEANRKSATRTLRKFLRADAVAKGGKVGTDTPGKGGRYAIDLNKRDLNSMVKRFKVWQEAEAKAAETRKAARDAAAPKAEEVKVEEPTIEATEDKATDEVAGPSDEELADMLADLDAEASDEETE